MKIALAQINSFMGDIRFNEKKVLQYIQKAKKQKADLIIFPEMALSGYPPLDLLYRKNFIKKINQSIKAIHNKTPKGILVLLGTCSLTKIGLKNSILLIQKNKKIKIFSKQYLADYDVFDEKRYFKMGSLKDNFFSLKNKKIQILICEELWQTPDILKKSKALENPKLILSFNASPFGINKAQKREQRAKKWVKKYKCPFVYLNAVGGQEEIIFDGGSFILSPVGKKLYQSECFKEECKVFSFSSAQKIKKTSSIEQLSSALIFGIKEFVQKNGFQKVHLGLSGGVDSALTAELACKALGSKNVSLFFLPSPFTSALSKKQAQQMAHRLNCSLQIQAINSVYSSVLSSLKQNLSDVTKGNIQARLRNLFLMTYANKQPTSLLLGPANKSELACGYATLYGDLAGGLLPLGDLYKTEIYKLARFLKIPSAIINRAPTAELQKNQKDTDDLPPYSTLDPILTKLIEEGKDPQTTFEKKIYQRIIKSEFKRRQAPPILKVKNYGFDRGWRWPLSLSSPKE